MHRSFGDFPWLDSCGSDVICISSESGVLGCMTIFRFLSLVSYGSDVFGWCFWGRILSFSFRGVILGFFFFSDEGLGMDPMIGCGFTCPWPLLVEWVPGGILLFFSTGTTIFCGTVCAQEDLLWDITGEFSSICHSCNNEELF